jgi:hypothetical protein
MLSMYSIGIVESVAMDENGADAPEQVLKFVPKERLRGYAPRVEEAGEAIIAKIQQAADLSNENCHRAMSSIMLAAALCAGSIPCASQDRERPSVRNVFPPKVIRTYRRVGALTRSAPCLICTVG